MKQAFFAFFSPLALLLALRSPSLELPAWVSITYGAAIRDSAASCYL